MTTYVSYSLPIGAQATGANGVGYQEDAITVGTLATSTTGVVELRVDTSTVTTMTRKDIEVVMEAFERRLQGALYGATDFGMI